MYFLKPIAEDVRSFQNSFNGRDRTTKLLIVAFFACIASILQSAGGFLPGVGYLISPLATAPILLCSIFSVPFGFMSYALTNMLLFIIQPTELIIFPFTTGLLGLSIGAAFFFFNRRMSVIATGAVLLSLGILMLLYIFQYPILGPVASSSFSVFVTSSILIFAFFYSWLWVEIALVLIKRLAINDQE